MSVQGRALCPSTNNVRPIFKAMMLFKSGDGVVSQRLGHFLWKGIKPFPALGTLLAKAPHGYADLCDLCGLARKDSNERKRRNRDAILYPR